MIPTLVLECARYSDRHFTGSGHPERAERVKAVEAGIERAGLGDSLVRRRGRPASRQELLRVHQATYLDSLSAFIAGGGGDLDPTRMCPEVPGTPRLWAAGSGLDAVEALDRGDAASAFVVGRPAGHHATSGAADGFLPAEQHRRHGGRPGRAGRTGRDRRLGRSSRKWDAGHFLGRSAGALYIDT